MLILTTQRDFDSAAQEALKVVFDDLERIHGSSEAVQELRAVTLDVLGKIRHKLYME